MRYGRAIGPIGTAGRLAVGAGIIAAAFVLGEVRWNEAGLGLAVFPAVLLLAHLIRLHFSQAPLRATGPVGHLVNCAVLTLLLIVPATRDATLLWLSASMLVAAWHGYAGCESLALSNWLLRRDDQVGCVVFFPLDEWEARTTRAAVR